eukprot:2824693-Amphidinium_carterae.3
MSVIHEGEVCAPKVRRVLLPLGKLVRQCGLTVLWNKRGMNMVAPDRFDKLRLVIRPTLRQGGMPHVSQREVEVLRDMLKKTRSTPRVVQHEEWAEALNLSSEAVDTCFQVLEEDHVLETESGVTDVLKQSLIESELDCEPEEGHSESELVASSVLCACDPKDVSTVSQVLCKREGHRRETDSCCMQITERINKDC